MADGLVEINDPEIDAEEIMAEIRQRIERRRQELGYAERTFPEFGAVAFPSELEGSNADWVLLHHLRLANDSYIEMETEPNLMPSPATRVPVLGRLWSQVRAQAHSLVLYYVNRSLAQQTNVNRNLISVLNRLAAANHEQQHQITELETQLAAIQAERSR